MKLIKVPGIALLLCMLVHSIKVNGQELKVGDKCPSYTFTNVINYIPPVLRLSDFKGRVIILDFWNTYCSSCIQAFPKLDSLQKLFKEKIQIILVNGESKEKTELFFKRHPIIKRPSLPMIVGDTKLKASFPSNGQPYIVWIDTLGVVKNFSNGTNVSKQNLQYFIDSKKLLFRDPTLEISGQAVEESDFEYISFISHCYETLNIGNSEIQESDNGKSVSIKSNCSSITDLFIKAFSEFGKYNFQTSYGLRLHVADSIKYLYPQNLDLLDHWLNENAYNYQLILPKQKNDQAYKIMQEDLIRYFDMDVSIKKTYIEAVAISKDPETNKIEQQSILDKKRLAIEFAKNNPDSVIIFESEPFEKIIEWLKMRLSYFIPIIADTGYQGNISLILRKSSLRPFRFQQFSEDLQNAGFICQKKYVAVDVLFIYDKSNLEKD